MMLFGISSLFLSVFAAWVFRGYIPRSFLMLGTFRYINRLGELVETKRGGMTYSSCINKPHSQLLPVKSCAIAQFNSVTLRRIRMSDVLVKPVH
jgi:hypothetical protein